MKISVVTVSYNSENTIEDTLRSVASQDYPEVEHILIDGASTDRTLEIANTFKKDIDQLVSEKDTGIYNAINKGIGITKGEIIGILNSDDIYANSEILSKVAKAFERYECDAVYGNLVYVDRFNKEKIIRKWIAGEYQEGKFLDGWMPPHPTFFLKKSCYQKYGMYFEKFKLSSDYELMLRMIHKHKIVVKYIPETLVKMSSGGLGNKNLWSKVRGNLEDRKAWKINGLRPGIFTLWRKPLSKLNQYF